MLQEIPEHIVWERCQLVEYSPSRTAQLLFGRFWHGKTPQQNLIAPRDGTNLVGGQTGRQHMALD
jgi:hypothetical protein